MKTLDRIGDLTGKHVLMRADFDVALGANGAVEEEYRIVRQRGTLEYLLSHGARVVLASHIGSAPSFKPLLPQLERHLGVQIRFCRDFDELSAFWKGPGNLALLENLRANPGETDNSEAFAGQLVAGSDLYVNNAFAVCHREHASVATAPLMLESCAGLLVQEEVGRLSAAASAPADGKVIFMSGAKASTKVPVIRALLDHASTIALGGIIANDLLRERGVDILASRTDEDAHALMQGLDVNDARLTLPTDFTVVDGQYLDIGPITAAAYAELARGAKRIIWNGPMGKFEDARFLEGTRVLARAIADSSAEKVVGGGDTVAAIAKCGLRLDAFGFVSTGGGAMLAFLAGQQLPGLKALGYYDHA